MIATNKVKVASVDELTPLIGKKVRVKDHEIGIFLTAPSLNTTKITIAKYTMTNNAYHKIPKIIVCVPLSNETKLLNVE